MSQNYLFETCETLMWHKNNLQFDIQRQLYNGTLVVHIKNPTNLRFWNIQNLKNIIVRYCWLSQERTQSASPLNILHQELGKKMFRTDSRKTDDNNYTSWTK